MEKEKEEISAKTVTVQNVLLIQGYRHLHNNITISKTEQLPGGLIAQLAQHCNGIAEVMSSNPVQA